MTADASREDREAEMRELTPQERPLFNDWIGLRCRSASIEVLFRLWRDAGGDQHGPRIETLTMPLEQFGRFVDALLAAQQAEHKQAMQAMRAMWDRAQDLISKQSLDIVTLGRMAGRTSQAEADLAAAIQRAERAEALNANLCDELEGELNARYPADTRAAYPGQQRRYDRDMATVVEARAAIGTAQSGGERG